MNKTENSVTKEDTLRFELFYVIKGMYQERVVDKIVNSIFNEVVINREGKVKDIEILARNNIPDFKCKCGKPARDICSQCIFEIGPEALLCSQCAKKHECGEEMLLPVVNSPRIGMCGYTGD